MAVEEEKAQPGEAAETPAVPVIEADAEAQGEPNPFEGATQAASSAPAPAAGTGEDLTSLLEDARSRADDHWDQLLRSRAEMENLRRRHASELEKAHKYALDSFVKDLVGVRDSLELALEAARLESADLAKLREGTDLTLKQPGGCHDPLWRRASRPHGRALQSGVSPGHHHPAPARPGAKQRGNRDPEGLCAQWSPGASRHGHCVERGMKVLGHPVTGVR